MPLYIIYIYMDEEISNNINIIYDAHDIDDHIDNVNNNDVKCDIDNKCDVKYNIGECDIDNKCDVNDIDECDIDNKRDVNDIDECDIDNKCDVNDIDKCDVKYENKKMNLNINECVNTEKISYIYENNNELNRRKKNGITENNSILYNRNKNKNHITYDINDINIPKKKYYYPSTPFLLLLCGSLIFNLDILK
jgi:hypothetical protein